MTAAIGRPGTIYVLVMVAVAWTALNLAAPHLGWKAPDPAPFFWFQGAVAFYAALITTAILTTQNRQNRHAEQRAALELQVNLLAEKKAAKIIALLEELRRDLPAVRDRVDSEADGMQQAMNPSAVLTALEQTLDVVADD